MRNERLMMIVALLAFVLPMVAQSMSIVGFARQKDSPLKQLKIQKSKGEGTLLLTTDEKGFTFKANTLDGNGAKDVQAEEGDGLLTLKVPHKTRYLTITHPDYGQKTWRVPDKGLRKKKIYHAYLQTYDPSKNYKLQKQWVVLQVLPKNAIVHVDSMTTIVRDGLAQFHLPLGQHTYQVESPFFQSAEGTLELTDDEKLLLPVTLQPVYSYLTVKTPSTACRIYIDNQMIGQYEVVSRHIVEGNHRLSVFIDSLCYYDAVVKIGSAEKKVIKLTASDLSFRPLKEWDSLHEQQASVIQPDRQPSIMDELLMEDEFSLPGHDIGTSPSLYGYLNIYSNVTGANVYVNGRLRGVTPCIIEHLNAGKYYSVRLEQSGYKTEKRKVFVLGNDLVNLEIKMNKRKQYGD